MSGEQALRAGVLLLVGALAPLAGCTTGKTFSIAMTDPGPLTTVLVVGDADGGGEASTDKAISLGPATPPVGSGAAASASDSTQIFVSTSPSTLAALVTTPVAAATAALASTSGLSVQVGTAVDPALATVSPSQAVQVVVTAPISTSSSLATSITPLAVTTPGVSAQLATPVVAATVAATPSQGLLVAVTSPASASIATVAGVASSSLARAQTALAGSSAVLSAPAPGKTTSPVSGAKTLVSILSKLKHS